MLRFWQRLGHYWVASTKTISVQKLGLSGSVGPSNVLDTSSFDLSPEVNSYLAFVPQYDAPVFSSRWCKVDPTFRRDAYFASSEARYKNSPCLYI
jgi:hypothetical protein